MIELLIFNFVLIAITVCALLLCKSFIKSERGIYLLLLCAAIFTILCHYSSLPYHLLTDGKVMEYLRANPNLLLPIYPCNVVMWCCLIYGAMRNKETRVAHFLCDFIFWFGIVSTLVGMFANVDFIREPTLTNFDVTKGIIAHATMLFNVLLLPVFGKVKINIFKNTIHILISVILMLALGAYCNLVFEALVSKEMASQVNSMFLLHSPFDGIPYLTYPVIALISIVIYFVIFSVCELIKRKMTSAAAVKEN